MGRGSQRGADGLTPLQRRKHELEADWPELASLCGLAAGADLLLRTLIRQTTIGRAALPAAACLISVLDADCAVRNATDHNHEEHAHA